MKLKSLLFISLISLGVNAQITGTINKVTDKSVQGVETVYSDGKKVVETAYSDTREAVKYVTPKIESALAELGKTLKTGSGEVWKILVKQQKVYAWSYLCLLLLGIISWIHFYYRFERMNKSTDKYGEMSNSNVIITIACFVMSISLSFGIAVTFQAMLTGFINPEYSAMKTILEVAKNIK